MRSSISNFKRFVPAYRIGLILALLLVGAELVFRLTTFGPAAVIKPWQYLPLGLKLSNLVEHSSKKNPSFKLAANKVSHFKGAAFSTNSYGFRDREFKAKKPDGTIRIAVMGASVSMGSGVQDHETYSRVLQDLFEQAGYPQVEILNFAVGAYNTPMVLASYDAYIARFAPDVVVLHVFPENLASTEKPGRYKPKQFTWHHMRRYLDLSFIANWLRVDMNNWRRKNLAKDWKKRDRIKSGAEMADNLQLLKEFSEKLSATGTELFLVNLPFPGQEDHRLKRSPGSGRLQETLDWLHSAKGFTYADYEQHLASKVTGSDIIYMGDSHPDARVHRLYAEAIYQNLAPFLFEQDQL